MCPGFPAHLLHEHQQKVEGVSHQQVLLLENLGNMQGQLQRTHLEISSVHNLLTEKAELLDQVEARLKGVSHQQALLLEHSGHQQGQLHRIHLEFGGVHRRLTEKGETMDQVEARLKALEVRCKEVEEKTEEKMVRVAADLQAGGSLLAQVSVGLADLKQQQPRPPSPSPELWESPTGDEQEQKVSPKILADQGTQTDPQPSAPAATLSVPPSPDSFRPASQCDGDHASSHRSVQGMATPPPGGASFSLRTFLSTVGIALFVGWIMARTARAARTVISTLGMLVLLGFVMSSCIGFPWPSPPS